MTVKSLKDTVRGWLIGSFEPSVHKTSLFEIGVLSHKKGEDWPKHYHKIATEYNVLVSGSMRTCDHELKSGDIFVIEPNEISQPTFHEDCVIVCIKIPSVPGDKYVVI